MSLPVFLLLLLFYSISPLPLGLQIHTLLFCTMSCLSFILCSLLSMLLCFSISFWIFLFLLYSSSSVLSLALNNLLFSLYLEVLIPATVIFHFNNFQLVLIYLLTFFILSLNCLNIVIIVISNVSCNLIFWISWVLGRIMAPQRYLHLTSWNLWICYII